METPVTLGQIETACRRYDSASVDLELMTADLERDLEEVKGKHLRRLQKQAAEVAAAQAECHTLIERGPDLFIKPRTVTMHGVKTGYILAEGKLVFDDAETVLKLVRRRFKDDAETYIRTTEEPNKDALRTLDATALAALGCRIEGAGDQVVLKRVAGDVEKLLNKLIAKMAESMVGKES